MENSTKAILMAAGVFFALIALSLIVVMLRNIQTMSEADETKKEAQSLQEWNAQWEAYNKRIMYGSDVLTVVNKAAQENYVNEGQEKYQITIKILKENGTSVSDEEESVYLSQNKLAIFECTGVEYNAETGRVNKMTFKNTGK